MWLIYTTEYYSAINKYAILQGMKFSGNHHLEGPTPKRQMSHSLSYVETGFLSSGICISIVVLIKDLKKKDYYRTCWDAQRKDERMQRHKWG